MNAASRKKEVPPAAGFLSGWIPSTAGPLHHLTTGVVLIVALMGSACYAWHRWGSSITAGSDYVLQAEQVQITPPPSWIRADVRAEVVRDGALAGVSILDRQLTVKVAQAFAMHSWVEQVSRVSKHHPARVTVELIYRKPVAMVEVVHNQRPGLLPIDADGVLLPPQDFCDDEGNPLEQMRDYLRIAVPHATPIGPVGTAWGQAEVHEAARIAAVFRESWKHCGLYRIQLVPSGSPDSTRIQPVFELHSRSGAAVIWGRAPDSRNDADTKTALAKVTAVLQYVQTHGSLEAAPPGIHLDLRPTATPAARTARVPP
jgi:hypothetical protein